MRRLLKEPLVHFLLAGLALVVIYQVSGSGDLANTKTVVVDKQTLLTFMQYRAKAFNQQSFEAQLDALTPEQLQLLIDDYVREETLYREAQTMQLERNDYIIRRRLIQKLEFITKGFADASGGPEETEVRQYFEDNKSDYYVEPYVTFTHVFYNRERHGADEAAQLAGRKLLELNRRRVPFTGAPSHGDRFFYHLNYVERTPDYVASHFGKGMPASVFDLDPGASWQGPFESTYGYHLVLVSGREGGRYPTLDELRERVTEDARQALIRAKTDEAIQEIVDSYDVRLRYESDETAAQ